MDSHKVPSHNRYNTNQSRRMSTVSASTSANVWIVTVAGSTARSPSLAASRPRCLCAEAAAPCWSQPPRTLEHLLLAWPRKIMAGISQPRSRALARSASELYANVLISERSFKERAPYSSHNLDLAVIFKGRYCKLRLQMLFTLFSQVLPSACVHPSPIRNLQL